MSISYDTGHGDDIECHNGNSKFITYLYCNNFIFLNFILNEIHNNYTQFLKYQYDALKGGIKLLLII